MKVAVIGYGKQGQRLTEKFKELGVLYGICDLNKKLLRNKRVKWSVNPITFLEDSEVTAIAIATPTAAHFGVALEALLRGKDVLIEKPMTISSKQAQILIDSALTDRILMVGHTTLYMQHMKSLKEIMTQVGKLETLHFVRTNPNGWREGSNVVWRLMSHDIATILGLFDKKPEIISAGAVEYKKTVEAAMARMKVAEVQITCYASWTHPIRERYVKIIGSEAQSILDEDIDDDPLMTECKHFIECCETREQPITDGKFGMKVVQVLEEIEKLL